MTVLATVVSRPTPERAIIDAGSKALTSDLLGLDGYGLVLEHPDAVIYQLNEEHGLLDVSRCASPPAVGDRVHVLPNHTCVVTNLFDRLFIVSGGSCRRACRSRRAASRSERKAHDQATFRYFACPALPGGEGGRLRLHLRPGAGRADGRIVEGGVGAQTTKVLENIAAALALAGCELSDVVKTTVWLKRAEDFAEFNAAYAPFFPNNPPARSTAESRLMIDILVEIEAIAYKPLR